MLLGAAGTGKSSLVQRITKNYFSEEYNISLGIGFNRLIYHINENKVVEFQLYDCPGNERFSGLLHRFTKFMKIIVLCYDCSSHASFDEMKSYYVDYAKKMLVFIVGLKSDITKREVDVEAVKEYADQYDIPIFGDLSCATGVRAEDFVHYLGDFYLRHFE
uniref:Uncharacterized protein n=1 Tax=Arcella intermedia TaxID=1963864 RepID=A0A6B2LMK4_9EUKA